MTDYSLVKVDLSEAANTLIARMADGFGVLYEPRRIRERAKADADAAITMTKANVRIDGIQRRAMQRLLIEEQKKQRNIEAILAKAVPQVKDTAKPAEVDNDWLANFFEKAKLTSDAEMQAVWSSLLAGEANHPGTFSRRTVNLVSELEKDDARLFSELSNFCWDISGSQPLIYDVEAEVYSIHGINFRAVTHLDSLGLISFNNLTGYKKYQPDRTGGQFAASYGGSTYILKVAEGRPTELPTGTVLLTAQGNELMRICTPHVVKGFEEYVITKFRESQLEVTRIDV